jgi:replicative DNA helicase
VWFKEVMVKGTLKVGEAKRLWKEFFIKTQREIKVFSYINGSLTISEMRRVLNKLKKDGFEPELILVDYVDIMEAEKEREHRHKEN